MGRALNSNAFDAAFFQLTAQDWFSPMGDSAPTENSSSRQAKKSGSPTYR
jgi:hypothetical protein